jgi:enoyl-[acyl-carrier protein] reductase II
MGTRFVCSTESPVHVNYKQGIADAASNGSLPVPMGARAVIRVLRSPLSEAIARGEPDAAPSENSIQALYVEGRLDRTLGSAGESAGLIHAIKPVAAIVDDTIAGFWREIERLAGLLERRGALAPAGA